MRIMTCCEGLDGVYERSTWEKTKLWRKISGPLGEKGQSEFWCLDKRDERTNLCMCTSKG